MKKLLVLSTLLLFLTGCQEISTDQKMPAQTLDNPYATKKILILSKLTTYKGSLIERITLRLKKTYSFVIDDLDTIYNYNFSHYKSVILIETPVDNKLPVLNGYFNDFAGVNNMVILAVSEKPFTQKLNFECLTVSPNTANITETAELVIEHIRTTR